VVLAYDDTDRLEDIMSLPSMRMIGRAMLYDGLRTVASDGPLTADELDRMRSAADSLGIAHHVLDELHAIVRAEHGLRKRRYELITAPVLPGHGDPTGAAGGKVS
jgi:hypothetical protein